MCTVKQRQVVHVIGALVAGGAERFVVELIIGLAARGVNCQLWVLSNRTDNCGCEMRKRLVAAGVELKVGPGFSIGFRSVFWYINNLRKESPYLIHLHTPNTELCHFLSKYFVGWKGGVYRTLHSTNLEMSLINQLAYRGNYANLSVACSKAVGTVCRKLVKGKIQVIENGVNFDFQIKSSELSLSYKKSLGLDSAAFHFLHVGRMAGDSLLASPKAQDALIKAWLDADMGYSGAVLHLLGDGLLRSELEQLARGDPSICFHGVKSNVTEWLLAADVFIMPSRFEGLPIAGIEAIGAGLPCIFSMIEPLRELRPPCVVWVRVDDVCSLVDAMRLVMTNRPVPAMAEVHGFRNKYSIRETEKRYLKVYGFN